MIPQIMYLILISVGLGVTIAKNGQPRGPHNILPTVLSAAIALALLYWGGFFDVFFVR